MADITPNTANPVREDAYVTELATKLGIDAKYIPKSPTWRNEEEIKVLADLFANMSGGGGGGGGALVSITTNGNTKTLNKTGAELYVMLSSGINPVFFSSTGSFYQTLKSAYTGISGDWISNITLSGSAEEYTAYSANAYPSYVEGGGGDN